MKPNLWYLNTFSLPVYAQIYFHQEHSMYRIIYKLKTMIREVDTLSYILNRHICIRYTVICIRHTFWIDIRYTDFPITFKIIFSLEGNLCPFLSNYSWKFSKRFDESVPSNQEMKQKFGLSNNFTKHHSNTAMSSFIKSLELPTF